jgi:hypothetical protein
LEIRRNKKIDSKARKILTMFKGHHTKAGVDRPNVTRIVGGRVLLQIEVTDIVEIINTAECLNTKYEENIL